MGREVKADGFALPFVWQLEPDGLGIPPFSPLARHFIDQALAVRAENHPLSIRTHVSPRNQSPSDTWGFDWDRGELLELARDESLAPILGQELGCLIQAIDSTFSRGFCHQKEGSTLRIQENGFTVVGSIRILEIKGHGDRKGG